MTPVPVPMVLVWPAKDQARSEVPVRPELQACSGRLVRLLEPAPATPRHFPRCSSLRKTAAAHSRRGLPALAARIPLLPAAHTRDASQPRHPHSQHAIPASAKDSPWAAREFPLQTAALAELSSTQPA